MFTLADGRLVLAATDLTNHLACPHLTQQRLAIARGERGKPPRDDDPHSDLIRRRGDEHEEQQRDLLGEQCGGYADLSDGERFPHTEEQLEAAAAKTADAMHAGEPLIYQAHFFDGRWQGRTDFLRRVEGVSSNLGGYAYEVLDTKLARQVKPAVVHQLSLYSRLVARIQGVELDYAYVILGDGTLEAVELPRYTALHRHTVAQLEEIVEAEAIDTYPEPVAHCAICPLESECHRQRVDDDHLSLVANARRDQREQLVEAGLATVASLAEAPEDTDAGRMGAERFDLLRNQAALQVHSRASGQPEHRHLVPTRAAGYAAIPLPSAGDIFFDFEGDPYVGDGGLEYLWGWWTEERGYECLWAHDADEEKAALEAFVDHVVGERVRHPGMHVFHYAAHERSKLASLAVQYATREDEVDQLLREGVLVDLFGVVRHALQVGEHSYSLKRLERHHGFEREETSVRDGGGSIVAYEEWLEEREPDLLEAIRAYNEEDCRSTLSLRDWLLERMRPEAATQFEVDFDDLRKPEPEEEHGPPDWMAEIAVLIDQLSDGLAAEGTGDTADEAERRLLSQLLLYHWREDKPRWWRYFELLGLPLEQLFYARDAIASLRPDADTPPASVRKSMAYSFVFPPQEVKGPGGFVDPTTEEAHKVTAVDGNRLVIEAGPSKGVPEPTALIEKEFFNVKAFREALSDIAASILAGDDRFSAARTLLRREPPRLRSGRLGEDLDSLVSAVLGLDSSVLPVQGPPGTGKTYLGARMIVAAIQAGKRVGVTAQSHAAIQNMLADIEAYADEVGARFAGVYKGGGYESTHDYVSCVDKYEKIPDDCPLVAGTTFLFARRDQHERFDLLFVDEAGQLALANTVAGAAAAENVVLLGDPQQLPQVTQATHPEGSSASVLEHLLDGASTIPPDRGILLTESWRMHPEVCAFVSERSYDGRLRSRDACALRRVDTTGITWSGAGLRVAEVEHEGRSQESAEEADEIARDCRTMLDGGTVTDDTGTTRALEPEDIMVVAPYNLAVRRIAAAVPAGVRVGTVDRFQGQQAPVVFYAMTCSSGEDVPRGLDFLFSRNRLNVAVSRAECLAVLVLSPALLDSDCRTLEAMALVDGACRFVEMAEGGDGA